MRFSIVIPSFNQGRWLAAAIESILDQNWPAQIVVVDNLSTDGTADVLSKYRDEVDVVIREPDTGQSEALNKGFAQASGEIFGWLNADDVYLPGAFERAAELLSRFPRKAIVIGDHIEIDEYGLYIGHQYAFDFSWRHLAYEGFHCNAQATFWRAAVHERFGHFDTALHRTMDLDMFIRFGLNEGNAAFVRTSTALAAFRRHADQKTQEKDESVESEVAHILHKTGIEMPLPQRHIVRFAYRLRRLYWYVRRGGPSYAAGRLRRSEFI